MAKHPPLETVNKVDLQRYMGDWYVIANMPNRLEKGKVGTIDRYAMRPDGKIDNWFLFRKGSLAAPLKDWKAIGWVHNKQTNAEWRVQFIWPFRSPYLVIALDDNYQWTVVAHPGRKLGWILSRTPAMEEGAYQRLKGVMASQGYDVSRLTKVPQKTP